MRIDHINIKAPREVLDRTRDFYRDVFGLQAGYRPSFPGYGFWLYADGRAIIHLSETVTQPHPGGASLDHVAFRVDALEPIIDRLDKLGVEFSEVTLPDGSLRQIFFRDTAGVRVEVNCPPPGAAV